MFKRGSLVMTIWNLIVAAGLIALGIATCINNANQDFRNVMIMIAGIFVIVDAGLRILTQVIQLARFQNGVVMKTDITSAVAAASELAVGILLIMVSQNTANMTVVLQYLILFISILLIVMGAVTLIYSIVFLVKKVGTTPRNIMGLILAAALIAAGILILVFATNEGMLQFIFVMLGITFMLSGIALVFVAILFAIAARRERMLAKAAAKEDPEAVEVPAEEEKPEAKEEPKEEPKEESEEDPKKE